MLYAAKSHTKSRNKCDYCSLEHPICFFTNDEKWICLPCDYLELVRRDSSDLQEAIKKLREYNLCAYCGEQATDVEHVIPKVSKLPTFTVPSCRECNLIASGKLFSCFEDKKDFIQKKLKKKYKKQLNFPEWDDEELAEMNYSLKIDIINRQKFSNALKQRLEWNWIDSLLTKE